MRSYNSYDIQGRDKKWEYNLSKFLTKLIPQVTKEGLCDKLTYSWSDGEFICDDAGKGLVHQHHHNFNQVVLSKILPLTLR